MLKIKLNNIYFLFLILIVAVILRYPGFNYLSDSDESVYLAAATQLKFFFLPYIGISDDTKGPLVYIINALLYYSAGETIQGFRIVGSVFIALTSFILFKIIEIFSFRLYSFFWSVVYIFLVTYLYTPGYLFLPAHIVNLFIVLAYYYLIKKNFFLIGFFLGLASLTKQSYIIVSFLIFFYLFFFKHNQRKIFIPLTLGYLVPFVIISLFYIFDGTLILFLKSFLRLSTLICAIVSDENCYNNRGNFKFIFEFHYLLMTVLNIKYLTYSTIVTLWIILITFLNLKFSFIIKNINDNRHDKLLLNIIFILSILTSIAFHPTYELHHILEIVPFFTIFLAIIFFKKTFLFLIAIFFPILFMPVEFYLNSKRNFYNPLNSQLDKYFADKNFFQKKTFIGPGVSHGMEAMIKYHLINITKYTYPEKIFSINFMKKYYGQDFNYNKFFLNIISYETELVIIDKPINEFFSFFDTDVELIETFNEKYNLDILYQGKIYNRYVKNFYRKDYSIKKIYIYKRKSDIINK
jgi:hypothetical protein